MRRAELEGIDPATPTMGSAEAVGPDEGHTGHSFIYLPDLSSLSHWATHMVPPREEPRERHPVGFRRSDR
jgi:hypothetical protein